VVEIPSTAEGNEAIPDGRNEAIIGARNEAIIGARNEAIIGARNEAIAGVRNEAIPDRPVRGSRFGLSGGLMADRVSFRRHREGSRGG
jgi:hypothetical protein